MAFKIVLVLGAVWLTSSGIAREHAVVRDISPPSLAYATVDACRDGLLNAHKVTQTAGHYLDDYVSQSPHHGVDRLHHALVAVTCTRAPVDTETAIRDAGQ